MPDHRVIFSLSSKHAYSIAPARHLYLDTSAVRRLGTRLWASGRVRETYTSVLTLIELLSDITKNEREFRARRSAIAGIMGGDVDIDWQMPDLRLRSAFALLRAKYDLYESRVQCVQRLLTCLATTETLSDFLRQESKLGLEHDLSYFSSFDRRISETHIEAARKWVPFNREQFRQPEIGDFLSFIGLPREASVSEAGSALGGSSFDFGLGLYALTKKFSEEEGHTDYEYHDALFKSYDQSIDLYIRAMSFQQWREIGRADMPGRNTAADLTHLEYVVDGSYVVTADDGMATQIMQAGGAVMSVGELDVA